MKRLFLAGLDHTTATVEVRERLAFSTNDLPEALRQLTNGWHGRPPTFCEVAILSTCNRVEIYGVANGSGTPLALIEFLAQFHRLAPEQFAPALYFENGEGVAHHLCATTAGLRSLVLGEAQIQGQVRQAMEAAQASGSLGSMLNRLFQYALSAGKRVRSSTSLGQGAASVSQAGVELARRRLKTLEGRTVLLIGSGEVSELAAQNLIANGCSKMLVVNRTLSNGQKMAETYGAEAFSFDELDYALARADIVISSTAAPVTILHREHIAQAMEVKCRERAVGSSEPPSIMLIDLAIPRDIEADVTEVPGVHLLTIDNLHEVVRTTLDQRAREVAVAEQMIDHEVAEFIAWVHTQEAVPTLTSLRTYAESLRAAELDRVMKRLSTLSVEERTVVEGLTRSIVNKLLHPPTRRLRDAAAQGEGRRYAAMVTDLFDLTTESA
jgi:glutamyl-tRNA reductase